MSQARIIKLLIFAMGGEGGLTLAHWLTSVAQAEGYRVQHTSLPGVAQRTGATSYYFEMISEQAIEAAETEPVFALEPAPGDVDIVFASELLEGVRAIDLGFVSPDTTTLITSSHREFLYSEKCVPGDGIISSDALLERIKAGAKNIFIGDFKAAATSKGAWLSPVLLGALAASKTLPFQAQTFRDILAQGASENIAGFEAGYQSFVEIETNIPDEIKSSMRNVSEFDDMLDTLPASIRHMSLMGAERLLDYQNAKYARTYLERISKLAALTSSHDTVLEEFARQLALWMSYEDVIRVAQLKTRPSRLKKLRRKAAGEGSIVRIVDFLKPGWQEFTSLLPTFIAKPLMASKTSSRAFEMLVPPLKINTTGVFGFTVLVFLRSLRPLRPMTYRNKHEHDLIERWTSCLSQALKSSPEVAVELVQCPKLLKGYGKVRDHGEQQLLQILSSIEGGNRDSSKIRALIDAGESGASK